MGENKTEDESGGSNNNNNNKCGRRHDEMGCASVEEATCWLAGYPAGRAEKFAKTRMSRPSGRW